MVKICHIYALKSSPSTHYMSDVEVLSLRTEFKFLDKHSTPQTTPDIFQDHWHLQVGLQDEDFFFLSLLNFSSHSVISAS